MTVPLLRRVAAATLAAATFGVFVPLAPARAADGVGDIPSVAIQPAKPQKGDPNGGQWFVLSRPPGGSGTVEAKVTNPASVKQSVSFSLRDLNFADDGTPAIANAGPQSDVGAWGGPAQKSVDIPPLSSVIVPFTVKVPSDAEPGDHVGAVVAITANVQNKFRVVRQIGARFYITVEGEAVRAYSIVSIDATKNSSWWPSRINTDVVLRNDGRTRVRPKVTIGGQAADGSRLLLSKSVEKYTATTKIPWYGGPVNLSVRAITDDGTERTSDKRIFVIPLGLLGSVVIGALVLFAIITLVRRRLRRVSGLRADVDRLERLVARQAPTPVEAAADPADDAEEAIGALLVAIKRAQRSGSPTSVARLALALHDADGPAVPWLVGVLAKVEGRQRDDVIAALRASDPAAVAAEVRRSDLSAADREAVLAEDPTVVPAAAETSPKPRRTAPKSPAKSAAKAPAKTPATRRTTAKSTTTTAPEAPAPRKATHDAGS